MANSLRLLISENETTGLPDVSVVEGKASVEHLDAIATFIRKNFEQVLTKSEGQIVKIDVQEDEMSAFRLSFCDQAGGRFPQIFMQWTDATELHIKQPHPSTDRPGPSDPNLDSAPADIKHDESGGKPVQSSGGWQEAMMADLEQAVLHARGENAALEWQSVRAVVQDMQYAAGKNPDKFLLLLLAGYLHVGEAVCGSITSSQDTIYKRAGLVLNEALGATLPENLFANVIASDS